MKYFLSAVVVLCLFWSTTSSAFAKLPEQISSFHAAITINQDTSLTITEEIIYSTIFPKHGIYRYIPSTYNQGGHKEVLPIRDIVVTDPAGRNIPFIRSFQEPFVTLKIGDPAATFVGEQTYRIQYVVDRGVRQFDEHVELYWDITGEGWQVPVLKSSATIHSKFAPIEKVGCFSGTVGSNDALCQTKIESMSATFVYDHLIEYGKNMTVAVWFPKENNLHFPTDFELLLLWLRYNWSVLFVPLPLLFMLAWWLRTGRDRQFVAPNVFLLDSSQPTQARSFWLTAREPFVYEPLKDLTPGEAGALLNEKVDIQDVLAELLELARKKYLTITAVEKKKLFGTKTEYVFKKNAPADASLSEAQLLLYKRLFKSGDETSTARLKGHFYTTISRVQEAITASLVAKKAYSKHPTTVRTVGVAAFIIASFGVGALLVSSFASTGIVWPFVALVTQLPFGFLLAYNLPQKTAVGSNLWLQARGLRKTIVYGKWREVVKEKNLFIEEILPFAVSLGVVTKLAHDMKELGIANPEYLQGNQSLSWSTADWMNDFTQQASSSLSYNPSSSSSSGGSGFSGGGSSGGGGGGGGGGSW